MYVHSYAYGTLTCAYTVRTQEQTANTQINTRQMKETRELAVHTACTRAYICTHMSTCMRTVKHAHKRTYYARTSAPTYMHYHMHAQYTPCASTMPCTHVYGFLSSNQRLCHRRPGCASLLPRRPIRSFALNGMRVSHAHAANRPLTSSPVAVGPSDHETLRRGPGKLKKQKTSQKNSY